MILAGLSDNDARELDRFSTYVRLVGDAMKYGCTYDEARRSIYPDIYPEEFDEPVASSEKRKAS